MAHFPVFVLLPADTPITGIGELDELVTDIIASHQDGQDCDARETYTRWENFEIGGRWHAGLQLTPGSPGPHASNCPHDHQHQPHPGRVDLAPIDAIADPTTVQARQVHTNRLAPASRRSPEAIVDVTGTWLKTYAAPAIITGQLTAVPPGTLLLVIDCRI